MRGKEVKIKSNDQSFGSQCHLMNWNEFQHFRLCYYTFISLAVYGGKFVILMPLIMKGKEVKAGGKEGFNFHYNYSSLWCIILPGISLFVKYVKNLSKTVSVYKYVSKIQARNSLCFSCLSNARLPFPLRYYHLTFGINHLIKMNVQAF